MSDIEPPYEITLAERRLLKLRKEHSMVDKKEYFYQTLAEYEQSCVRYGEVLQIIARDGRERVRRGYLRGWFSRWLRGKRPLGPKLRLKYEEDLNRYARRKGEARIKLVELWEEEAYQ